MHLNPNKQYDHLTKIFRDIKKLLQFSAIYEFISIVYITIQLFFICHADALLLCLLCTRVRVILCQIHQLHML